MKNISLIINGILAVAVGILFYQVNALKNTSGATNTATEVSTTGVQPLITANSVNLADAKIAYINTDSINDKYQYIADFTKVLKSN